MSVRKPLSAALSLVTLVLLSVCFTSCHNEQTGDPNAAVSTAQSLQASVIPTSPGPMPIPANNPMTVEKAALGKYLFFDKALGVPFSKNGVTTAISCASCHSPERAFSDSVRFSPGIDDKKSTRHAPSLVNTGYSSYYTWEGRYYTFETHVFNPIFSALEMGNNLNPGGHLLADYLINPGSNDTAVLFKRLHDSHPEDYSTLFRNAYGDTVMTLDRIAKALATYERTLVSTGSPFDDYNKYLHSQGGNRSAISERAKRGFKLFSDSSKTNCISCHSGYLFSNNGLANNGLAPANSDVGRKNNTYNPAHRYQFKVPTLRNVSLTAPYMHDGRFATLEQVMEHYIKGGSNHENLDSRIRPLQLSSEEVKDIIAFLTTLTDKRYSGAASAAAMKNNSPSMR